MVWAAFSRSKQSEIVFLEENVNSELYVDILEHNLLPMMGPADIFQQDNASCHKSRTTMAWFQEKEVAVMDWPAISPDLNPIENLWAYMQQKVYEEARSFDCRRDLMQKITDVWADIPQIMRDNLIDSMPKRMDLVLKEKGERI